MQPPQAGPRRAAVLYRRVERAFDGAFAAALNPLKHLGALAVALFCLLAATGAILYAVFDTSAQGAYRSIDELSRQRGSIVGVLRGLHRYGADAFVLVTLAHLAREWLLGRFGGFRTVSWLTGVALLPLAYASGIGGFWLNWDRLGQFSAIATAEWLDALPFLAAPLARNFLDGAVTDRLFSLFVFVHLGLPLLLVFGIWFHVQRISRPAIFPPLALALGTGASLLLLALLLPVRSQGAADLMAVPVELAFDWFLLFLHPLADTTSAGALWAALVATLGVLLALPLWRKFFPLRGPQGQRAGTLGAVAVAAVDPRHCNGCRRCADDCPYDAITMVPHPNGRRGAELAQVSAQRCASCGICAGSCPAATPLRRSGAVLTGIEMPQWPLDALRQRLARGLAAGARHVVFGCDHGARVQALDSPHVLVLSLHCAGMLPPAFVEYALRHGAAGVLVAGCREGACEFRLGQRWTAERLRGAREPRLRAQVPAGRWATVWADAGEEAALQSALDALRHRAPAAPATVRLEAAA